MSDNKGRGLIAWTVNALIALSDLATGRITWQIGTWTVRIRSVCDWLRPCHHYPIVSKPDGTKAIHESKSLFIFHLSRPLHGPKAEQMIAFYESFPQKPGQYYALVQARRW